MNKKLFLGMFAAASMLLATSCSNDELDVVQSGNEAQVTFSLATEGGIETRAISDGKSADVLMYAVFDKEGNRINTIQKVSRTGVTFPTTENITLAKGQTYKVAFWAQDKDCKAYTVSDDMKVTVNYANNENKVNNDETRDAFFKTVEFTVSGNQTIDVELKRPFAQINVGVYKTDWEAAVKSGIEIKESSVVIKKAATSINLLTGEVGAETTDVEVSYSSEAIPNEELKVDLNGDGNYDENEKYKWLSMSYILVADRNSDTDNSGVLGDERATLESLQYTFSPASGNEITFGDGLSSVPVQRNWRTNILGQILTGNIEFNITINPIFEGDNNVDAPTSEVISVGNAQDLKNALNNSLVAGNTVVLDQDIDLTNETWEVAAPWQGSSTNVVFDGGGHKIIGLTTSGLQGGLLGKFNSNGDITIKNLTLENVTITGTDADGESAGGALIGWIENHGASTITIENVKVEGIKAQKFKYIGGLIGYNNGNVAMNLVGCSVTGKADSYINSTYNESGNYKGHVGGLLGLWVKGSLTNCEVKDIVIKHDTNDMTGSSNRAGALVGTKYSGVTVTSATVENVKVDGANATTASLFGPNASQVSDSDKSNVTIK